MTPIKPTTKRLEGCVKKTCFFYGNRKLHEDQWGGEAMLHAWHKVGRGPVDGNVRLCSSTCHKVFGSVAAHATRCSAL